MKRTKLYIRKRDKRNQLLFYLQSVAVLVAFTVSWTYSSVIFLSGCTLFNLVCNFQVIRFENYGKLLERDLEVSQYIEGHIRLTHYMSKISQRFRIFFSLVAAFSLLCISHNLRKYGVRKFLFVDLSHGHSCAQLDSEYANKINVTAIGLVICLHVATKVSHRAQGIVSVATRWHSVSTNEITSQMEVSRNGGGMEAPLPISLGLLPPNLLGDLFGGSRTIIWASMIGDSDPFFNHPEDYV
ncbi:hypothetical protein LINPERHAP2_LOCUS15699 [Linum perenne]